MDPIQGRILSKILKELKEEYIPRVAFQQETESSVPQVQQTAFWKMKINKEFVLQMWQGRTLYSKLQPGQKEWYWSTWKEIMAGQELSITTGVI